MQIVRALREACQVENDPELVTSYLTFLAQHAASSSTDLGEMTELVLDMAQLIVERSIIMPAVLRSMYETDTFSNVALKSLLKIFHTYLNKVSPSNFYAGNFYANLTQICAFVGGILSNFVKFPMVAASGSIILKIQLV